MSLTNRRILITRDKSEAKTCESLVKEYGGIALFYPCIDVKYTNSLALDQAKNKLTNNEYDWVIITSKNSIKLLAKELMALKPGKTKLALVGSKTAALLNAMAPNLKYITPLIFTKQELIKNIKVKIGDKVLIPRGNLATSELANDLIKIGADVDDVIVYTTTTGSGGIDILSSLRHNGIDIITFASPSSVSGFISRLADAKGTLQMLDNMCIACIGTTTKDAALKHGLAVQVTPAVHTFDELLKALEDYYAKSDLSH